MSTKTIRPGIPAAMTAGRALLAAGWKVDSVDQLADGSTERHMLHPSGREITAITDGGRDTTELTLTNLTLEQAAGAVTGAGLGEQPEQTREIKARYLTAGMTMLFGDERLAVGTVHRYAEDTVLVYIDGDPDAISYHVEEAVTVVDRPRPAYMSCPRECGVDIREHNSSGLIDGHCDTDYWARLAVDLHKAADKVATLAGTERQPVDVELKILGSFPQDADPDAAQLVDALAAAFGITPRTSRLSSEHRRYDAMSKLGALAVDVHTYLPEEGSELERLRARVAELEAERAEDGAR